MFFFFHIFHNFYKELTMRQIISFVRWGFLLFPLGILVGSACALFLYLLETVTEMRFEHSFLLYLLPFAGIGVALLYHFFGKRAEGGNNLIIDELHQAKEGVPLRMAPLVFLGTIISHLFGASVGREGTAVQVGGSFAGYFAKLFSLDARSTEIILMAGVAAGFGAVFGTPVAGAVFALEFLTIGKIEYKALFPVFLTSFIADFSCRAWGISHTKYHVQTYGLNPLLMLKIIAASLFFGVASYLFAESVHRLSPLMKKMCPIAWLRPALGGVLTLFFVMILGTRDYLGLGVIAPENHGASLVNFFLYANYDWSWILKIGFTAIALSTGYKGGEVTPLFFVGAAAGNMIASLFHLPLDLLAGIGFVAVFAGAANTPMACSLMAIELFGGGNIAYYAMGCFVAYIVSGHTGIYLSQSIGFPKRDGDVFKGMPLRQARCLKGDRK